MKMGEVVEDANISQQHLQVASSVVVDDDEDEDDAANGRALKEYVKQLSLVFTPQGNSAVSSGEPGVVRRALCPFSQLPKHVDRKRRILNKKHLQILKRTTSKGNLQAQFKAKKEYELKFLEAVYVRNVLFQSLPRLPAPVSSSVEKVSDPASTAPSDKSKCGTSSDNKTNQKLDPNVDRTFCNNDAHSVVPKPSAISDYRPYCGPWFNCLKGKAMNDREPNHLLQVTYDNFVAKDAKALWLSKQPKKSRSPSTHEKGPVAVATTLPVDNTKSSEPPSHPVNSISVNLINLTPESKTDSVTLVSPKSDSGEKKTEASGTAATPVRMPSRSPDRDKVAKVTTVGSTTPPATKSLMQTLGSTISTALSGANQKPELERGRKSTGQCSTSPRKAVDTPKAGSAVSSNSSALSVKSVISENTDSSSSTSTSVSSSSLNENVSIGRTPVSSPGPIQLRGATNNGSNSNSSSYTNTTATPGNHGSSPRGTKRLTPGPKPPKKYSEKMKAEASVLQRITELQKEGMWWERRLPKVFEPPRAKVHWDYLLEEMTWMASDFMNERKWKRAAAKKCSRMIEKYFHEKELKRVKAEKDEEIRKRRTAGTIAKVVRQFWSNVQTVVEFKEQSIIDSMRKKALDQKLSYLVNETEKFSEIVAKTFTAINKKTGIDNSITLKEDQEDFEVQGQPPEVDTIEKTKSGAVAERMKSSTLLDDDMDAEFLPPSDSESDVDDTIAEEEAKERVEHSDHRNELDELEAENNMSYDQLVAKYAKYLHNPDAYKVPAPEPKEKPQEGRMTRRRTMSGRQLRPTRRRDRVKAVDTDVETDVGDTSSTEEESHDEDTASETERTNDDLASLLKSISFDTAQKNSTEEETNKLADLAESFKPKGYTLSSTTVVTKVPHLLRHTLREYQHIGLEWLVTMYDKRLNGILADEMGLGKTIQTIALLAYLAVERRNWGPHLIIVPTSVMLNWEMEFKKWCPGFKILTYYGSQKERKLKRSGWTKPNAFHVCITSYKLVIQDHQSFRRKRWKYLILDEAQNIKNFKSQRWQLLLNFNTQRRLLLTGTPLQNNLMELWSLLHFLMPNVFQSHMEFKDWFSNPMSGMVEGSQEYNEDIVRRLHKVLRPFILRRMKSEVEKQLPQKYEHVVMCSLSKRQRFLYEEFMSRTKTRDTLHQGNLLSVINVLMQLRKVCNHPNLFEPRPIVSPFQTEGINCNLPPCSWDVLRSLYEDSFRQGFPLFTISNPKYSYSEYLARRIGELTPLFAYNPDEERRYVVMNYEQCRDTAQPPAKRIRRIVNLVNNEPPPCPRMQIPTTFFISSGKPDKVLEDPDFVDYLRTDTKNKHNSMKVKDSSGNNAKSDVNGKSNKPITVDLTDSDKDSSTSESEVEVVVVKKRKVAKAKFDVATRLHTMGISVPDFELDFIQERKLHDRKLVVNNLNIVNWTRCRVHTFVNQHLVEKCKIVGALPPLRLTSRRTKIKYRRSILPMTAPRDYSKNGYFNLGFDEIMTMIKLRQECPEMVHHPLFMWSITSHLDSLVLTPESRLNELMSVLTRYVMYIPAVSAPSLETRLYRPSSSRHYFGHLRQLDEYRKHFFQSTEIIHPIVSRMLTQFPDPRLIQYDCGKLQTLDTLLRRLKTGSHRVLIFTQMAKVLDILEAFLNYHGHTYLRLDGATKIDQRQLLMERFNADTKIFCFILSTRSGGIGVNLTGADTVIFYDSDWNPTMDAQAQDRCHRIGQTRDVHIYRLVSEKTVEENILKKSNQKRLLGELAIEGGKFTTTYFKQHTIRDLFTINEKDDVAKRLNAWDNDQKSPMGKPRNNEDEDDSSFNPVELQRSPEKDRNRMHTIECALAAAEDDTDVQAAQTVHAEAQAEMAEFDENLSLDALDAGKSGPNKFELEFQQVYDQLTDVERYAMRLMEATIDDWSKETVAQAQKDLEEQKLAWELQQQKTAVEPQTIEMDDDSYNTEDLLTYSRVDPLTQVWMAQYGNFEQEMLFPMYEPPTPPHDEMDVYFDPTLGYLYDYDIMNEAQLPAVYVPKHPKKLSTTPVSPVTKPDVNKTPEPVKDIAPEVIELDSDSSPSPTKKSPKVGRREDPIFAPKSLFDRPPPALAKIRRDLRVARYCSRPAATAPKTLGPGSITFPIVSPSAQKAPAPPTPSDSPEWTYSEDNLMLQCMRNTLELPYNLLLVNLAQTPNWDFAQDIVNTGNFYPRNWKQCKWRFENVIAPREEGKLLLDSTSSSDPGSPSSGKKKKAKTFIKIAPPSPSKAARNVKLSQLMIQDNNQQIKTIVCSKFDEIKTVANKKAPTSIRSAAVNVQAKSNKHSQIITELGINYEAPLSAVAIAQARYERIQLERKKLQQQVAAATVATAPSPSPVAGVPTAIVSSGPAAVAAAMSAANGNANGNQSKSRGTFTQVTMSGTIAPLVIQANNSEIINRDVNIPNILAQQRNRQAELAQQQQHALLHRQALAAQAQSLTSLTSLLNQPQVSSQQPMPPHSQQPNVTVRTTAPKGYTSAEVQAILGSSPPITLMPGTNFITGRAPISVSSPVVNTSTTTMSSSTTLSSIARPLQPAVTTQPQVHRVSTITMQDLVSSATNTQRFQTSNISASPAPSVQTLPPQSQQPQPTLVSLTPMIGSGGQQLTTKLIQNPQGLATLVQSSPARTGSPSVTQQTASKLNPLQLQYLKQGLMRPASPASTAAQQQQQQQVQQIKDQLMNTTQIKRIQVVTASPPPPIVSSSGGITQPPAVVSLPSVSTIPTVSTFSPIPVVTATNAPVVTLSSAGTASKVSLSQPHVTIMQCQSSPNVIPPTHVIQHQPQPQRQLQLVKQHTVGGKTVTRPVSEAEVQAFLKQHGVNFKYPSQTTIPVTKTTPVASYQGPVPVPGPPTLLTVGLQDLVSSATNTQRFQTSNISTSPAPSVQTGPPQSQQSQPTLVSLTPMIGSGGQQLATKLIQNPQGLVTLVQSSPTRTGAPTITQQTGSKLSPLQLQYLKQGLLRPASPMTATVQQQQQVQQIKDHLMSTTQQIKRIQVVTASPPPPIVSSSAGGTQPPPTVSLPSVSTIPTVTTFPPMPVATSTNAPVVTLSSAGTASKVPLSQPHVTIMQCQSSPNVIPPPPHVIQHQQQAPRQLQVVSAPPPNTAILAPGPLTVRQAPIPSVSTAPPPINHTIQLKLPPTLAPPEENN